MGDASEKWYRSKSMTGEARLLQKAQEQPQYQRRPSRIRNLLEIENEKDDISIPVWDDSHADR